MKYKFLAVILIFSLLLGACASSSQPTSTLPAQPAASVPFSEQGLKNATYSGIYDAPVTLTDGVYEGKPFAEGDPAHPVVNYIEGTELYGDLNGDGVDDAVVFLLENSGGTANITYIAVQLNQGGQAVDAGAIRLDEVQVKSMSLNNGQVDLEVLTNGPGDADCCGRYKARKSFGVQNGRLAETTTANGELTPVSPSDLNGTFWKLVEINNDKPAAEDVPVNIEFLDGRIQGFGGCNNYNASFTLGEDNPLTMTVSPVASTKMACPDPAGGQEFTYLTALEGVSQWGYFFGRLALYYKNESAVGLGRLLFDPGPVPELIQSSTLTGQTWQWVSFTNPVEKYDIDTPENYTVTFNADGTLNIKADCNLANADYTDEAGALQVKVGPATMALCPGESRSEKFIQYLGSAARYFFQDGKLYIDLFADGGTMEFAPAAPGTGQASTLTGQTWQWTSFTNPVEKFDIDTPQNYTVTFNADGTLNIIADCNLANADFTDEAGALQVKVGPSTLALCPGESRSEKFIQYLGSAARYFFQDGKLYIDLFADGGTMEFAPAASETSQGDTLTGQTWQWTSFTNPVEKIDIDAPENYTVTFNADGTLNIKADCNLANADYTDEAGALQVKVGPSTLALCPGESRSEKFIQYLGSAARYFFQDGKLYIDLFADGGTMEFTLMN